ncbi:phosphatidate cytidylyltransferase [Priestia endophytica]|jgi:phosphatidate cytidylyltransferase|uniref:Phosphatidate cytidylyltransferase n=2 Tax=Priestia endophytica TaxID=135735 RepID=A0AAX1QEL9_9BACI|nr:phosphatidate cytidylyltransferase [Priestia endophytica]KAB2494668.1 phosphatidate cytidylyltransferase [Priestia endophytica]KYG35737.1 phosphatidate cytidylyltransferase [Priestia endophytica]MBG9814684.1 phosphatidate cytidylyltransferase [Priestia endophytica]MCM3539251.1 phosphatidate cytidylyltransferase [Priestia endophytica]RAS76774.1 phosphatidate cytidylyltransferase [Priestia endophytica]
MRQRIITGVIAAAIFVPLVLVGGLPFTLLVYLLATVGVFELLKMRKISLLSFPTFMSILLIWTFLLSQTNASLANTIFNHKVEVVLLAVLLLLTYTVLIKNRFTFDDAGFVILATIYIGMGFYYFIAIREEQLSYVFLALFVTWASDSGAYFIGKSMGKRKLWPDISPNKTIEGSVGGIVCGVIVALLFAFLSPLTESPLHLMVIGLVLSIFGQVGDLVESAFKRHYGVKDSGNILPGHGGVLDRTDSWLFVFPILYFLI